MKLPAATWVQLRPAILCKLMWWTVDHLVVLPVSHFPISSNQYMPCKRTDLPLFLLFYQDVPVPQLQENTWVNQGFQGPLFSCASSPLSAWLPWTFPHLLSSPCSSLVFAVVQWAENWKPEMQVLPFPNWLWECIKIIVSLGFLIYA